MKKLWIFGLVLVFSMFLTAGIAGAATHTVCASGCMHTTIQDAVVDAVNGDIIIVKPGTYNESVLVNKSVQILGGALGTNKLKTFVNSPTVDGYGFFVTASNVVISGFTIRGGNMSGFGIVMSVVDNVRVRYCTVEKSAYGIVISGGGGASNIRLAYNQVRYNTAMGSVNNGVGIMVQSNGAATPNIIMSYNQINDNDGYGIMVWGTGGSPSFGGMLIQYNTLVNNGSNDLTGPSNHNSKGFYFVNASGNITMNYNNIRVTDPPGNELVLAGPAVPVFLFTGNLKLPNARNTPAGPGVPFP